MDKWNLYRFCRDCQLDARGRSNAEEAELARFPGRRRRTDVREHLRAFARMMMQESEVIQCTALSVEPKPYLGRDFVTNAAKRWSAPQVPCRPPAPARLNL